jgi:hypothetical protein
VIAVEVKRNIFERRLALANACCNEQKQLTKLGISCQQVLKAMLLACYKDSRNIIEM